MAIHFNAAKAREARQELLDKAQAIHKVAEQESRDLTPDEIKEFDHFMLAYDNAAADVERAEKYEKAVKESASLRAPITPSVGAGKLPDVNANIRQLSPVVYDPTDKSDSRKQRMDDQWVSQQTGVGYWLQATMAKDHGVATEAAKHLQDHDCQVQVAGQFKHVLDAQTVDDLTRGGYLVPIALQNRILEIRDVNYVARELAMVYPMASEVDDIPVEGAGFTVYSLANSGTLVKTAGGAGEAAAITTSEQIFSTVRLTADDKYVLTYVSNKLMRGAVGALANFIADRMGRALAKQMDLEYIKGDGTTGAPDWGMTGLTVALGAAGKVTAAGNAYSEITAANLTSVVRLLPEPYHAGAKWVCSRQFFAAVIEPLVEAASESKADFGGPTPRMFKGYPVVFTEHMPKTEANSQVCLLFGDFMSSSVIGLREGLSIETSREFLFGSDAQAIRGRHAYDLNVYRGGDGSNVGGYVGLVTAAA